MKHPLTPRGVIERIAMSGEFYASETLEGVKSFITGANTETNEIFAGEKAFHDLVFVDVVESSKIETMVDVMFLYPLKKIEFYIEGKCLTISQESLDKYWLSIEGIDCPVCTKECDLSNVPSTWGRQTRLAELAINFVNEHNGGKDA